MAAKPLSIARLLGAPALVLALSASHAQAQLIIDPMKPPTAPPWNALKPFEPTPLPLLSDPDSRDPVAPTGVPRAIAAATASPSLLEAASPR